MRNSNGFQFYPGRRLPVVCRDGVTRLAACTGHAGNVIPAAVQIYSGGKRRTISGRIVLNYWADFKGGRIEYTFEGTGANAALIPWTAHKPRLAKLARKLIFATAYGKGVPGYAWGLPSDHSAALADVCRTEAAGLTEPPGQSESPGWIAYRLLRRLHGPELDRLAAYFEKLAKFQTLAGE